jgi:hypothetical protein
VKKTGPLGRGLEGFAREAVEQLGDLSLVLRVGRAPQVPVADRARGVGRLAATYSGSRPGRYPSDVCDVLPTFVVINKTEASRCATATSRREAILNSTRSCISPWARSVSENPALGPVTRRVWATLQRRIARAAQRIAASLNGLMPPEKSTTGLRRTSAGGASIGSGAGFGIHTPSRKPRAVW